MLTKDVHIARVCQSNAKDCCKRGAGSDGPNDRVRDMELVAQEGEQEQGAQGLQNYTEIQVINRL